MTDYTLHDKIEAYLLGDLPPAEVKAFEADMQRDPQLAEEVELHRLTLLVPDRLAELDLRDDFRRWQSEMESPEPPGAPATQPGPAKGYIPIRWLWVAATALLLLLAGAFWLWKISGDRLKQERLYREQAEKQGQTEKGRADQLESELKQMRLDLQEVQKQLEEKKTTPPRPTNKKKAPEYVEVLEPELDAYASTFDLAMRGAKSSDIPAENLISEASTAITRQQYRKAAGLLEKIGAAEPQYPLALEMLAYVYVKRQQYQKAVTTYQSYIKYDSDRDKTDWNLCLFYLADYPRYTTEFQTLLDKIIADPGHPYRGRAETMRAQLAARGVWPR